jgi:hypothetical protein
MSRVCVRLCLSRVLRLLQVSCRADGGRWRMQVIYRGQDGARQAQRRQGISGSF